MGDSVMKKKVIILFLIMSFCASILFVSCVNSDMLPENVKTEIIQVFCSSYDKDSIDDKDIEIRDYCGEYSGAYVVGIHCEKFEYATANVPQEFGEIKIIQIEGVPLYVYKNGELISLKEAYSSKILDDNDMKSIQKRHKQIYTLEYDK